jgi:hypothetical protein
VSFAPRTCACGSRASIPPTNQRAAFCFPTSPKSLWRSGVHTGEHQLEPDRVPVHDIRITPRLQRLVYCAMVSNASEPTARLERALRKRKRAQAAHIRTSRPAAVFAARRLPREGGEPFGVKARKRLLPGRIPQREHDASDALEATGQLA